MKFIGGSPASFGASEFPFSSTASSILGVSDPRSNRKRGSQKSVNLTKNVRCTSPGLRMSIVVARCRPIRLTRNGPLVALGYLVQSWLSRVRMILGWAVSVAYLREMPDLAQASFIATQKG